MCLLIASKHGSQATPSRTGVRTMPSSRFQTSQQIEFIPQRIIADFLRDLLLPLFGLVARAGMLSRTSRTPNGLKDFRRISCCHDRLASHRGLSYVHHFHIRFVQEVPVRSQPSWMQVPVEGEMTADVPRCFFPFNIVEIAGAR